MLDPNTDRTHEQTFLFNSDADQIRSDRNYDTWQPMNNYASREEKTAQNYANFRNWNSMGPRINESKITDDEGDGVRSPPLWKTTGRANNYRNMSPASRAQAIARGQRELMEMVKNMPESCYELSLKDLVEHNNGPLVDDQKEIEDQDQEEDDDRSTESLVNSRGINGDGEQKRNQMHERKKLVMRSRSIDSGGFLLKVFPISLGLGLNKKNMMRKKKSNCVVIGGSSNNPNNNNNNNISANVSPNPCKAQVGVDGSVKGGTDSDWWKMKRLSVSSERSESGVSSINSGSIKSSCRSSSTSSSTCSSRSSSTRRKSGGGCWSFILPNKNKRREIE